MKEDRDVENIPPTSDALKLHVKRSVLLGGHIYGQALQKQPNIPSPDEYGCQLVGNPAVWHPLWILRL